MASTGLNPLANMHPDSLHAQLRQATKSVHHALDHHPLLAPLLRQDLSLAQYGNALAALHGVQVQAEVGIDVFLAAQPGLFDYGPRRKLTALAADLQALGRSAMPVNTHFVLPEDVAELVGVLYTIEGATQGGQYIARHIHQRPAPDWPCRFFDGYGAQTQPLWRAFWEFADTHCPPATYASVIHTAQSMFEAVQRHLDTCWLQLTTREPVQSPARS